MNHYCTYFDRNYLHQGLALYRSLARHCASFKLWVLCFDETTYRILSELRLPQLVPVRLEDFERGDEPLLASKRNRSTVEYYWTCTPSLPLYLFRTQPEIEAITYLDADLFFFADPLPIYEEIADCSIAIIEHRYSPDQQFQAAINGIYNVGMLMFRNDARGLACLTWWRDRCIEWCGSVPDSGRFGDQKYLDDWPQRFESVHTLQHPGANLAPWNVRNYALSRRNNTMFVDASPIVFFHFHGFRRLTRRIYRPADGIYQLTVEHKRWLYDRYVDELTRVERLLRSRGFREQRKRPGWRNIATWLALGELTLYGHHLPAAMLSRPLRFLTRALLLRSVARYRIVRAQARA